MNVILINSELENDKAKSVVVDTLLSNLKSSIYSYNNYALEEFARNIFEWNGEYDSKGIELTSCIYKAVYNYNHYFWLKLNMDRVLNFYDGCQNVIIPDWKEETDVQYLVMQDYVDKVFTIHISSEGLPSATLQSNFTMKTGDEHFMIEQTLKLLGIMLKQ